MRFAFLLSLSAVVYGQSRPVEPSYDKATNQTIFTASSPIHLQASAEDRLRLCGLPRFDIKHGLEVTYRCSGERCQVVPTGVSYSNSLSAQAHGRLTPFR